MSATCRGGGRRARVRKANLNGLDFVEVSDDQTRLTVHFLGKAPEEVRRGNVALRGGRRVRDVRVTGVEVVREADPGLDDRLVVYVDKPGDFTTYTLAMVEADQRGHPTERRMRGFDARYATVDFTFKAGCPSPLDCAPAPASPPLPRGPGPADYLAKDYASFRQLMLDRLSVTLPGWTERHVPDVGIALVELMAYVGDELSYYQDAVATEAYLETARRRTSVRRHLRLIGEGLHEGCNARAFVHVEVDGDVLDVPRRDLSFVTAWQGMPRTGRALTDDELRAVPRDRFEVFEPMRQHGPTLSFRRAHNRIELYTWGERECCLPRGATSATLRDAWIAAEAPPAEGSPRQPPAAAPSQQPPLRAPEAEAHDAEASAGPDGDGYATTPPAPPRDVTPSVPGPSPSAEKRPPSKKKSAARRRALALAPGDLLLLEEVMGPWTGEPADANPSHRHVVRLTRVTPTADELDDTPVVEVEWHEEDALPFPLCISTTSRPPACRYLENVTVARGNVVLADHGETVREPAGTVGWMPLDADCGDCGCPPQAVPRAAPFRPALASGPVTYAEPLPRDASARTAMQARDPRRAVPAVWARFEPAPVNERGPERAGRTSPRPPLWRPRTDLLGSWTGDRHFVVETDAGVSVLRFGDGETGDAPEAGSTCTVRYRVGNGVAGNVGTGAIAATVRRDFAGDVVMRPRNPFPATGGTAAEALDQARMTGPYAFRSTLERAVAADDYARLAERHPRVQRAAAQLGWTGSWPEVIVAIDVLGAPEAEPRVLREVRAMLEPYRRIGHDVRVAPARYVPLDVALKGCVRPGYQRGHVMAALQARLGPGTAPDGTKGFFHPDNLSFGQGVLLSALVAAAQGVEGVAIVAPARFQRLHQLPEGELASGVLPLGPLEVARLDNDPNAPDNGVLTLDLAGGR